MHPSGLELWGFTSDLLTALLLFLALAFLLPRMRAVTVLAVLAVALIHHANYEHVIALGSSASYAYADELLDPTFLASSGLAPTRLGLLATITLLPLVLATLAARAPGARPSPRVAVPAALLILVAESMLPFDAVAMSWRQANVLAENVHWLVTSAWSDLDRSPPALSETDRRRVDTALALDLDGEPRFARSADERNVLLVILEGVSGAYLESVRRAHRFESTIDMPQLDRLATNGIVYRNFIANQRQTNRGEYALLCGDYPTLLTREPKMSRFETGAGTGACLPEAMRALGYRTYYLQAAPLPYMGKDRFLPAIGFERVLGARWFEHVPARALWGVDDRAFFEHAATLIRKLAASGEPWFLTLLNVGTHHPYAVPDETTGQYRDASLGEAMSFLDAAFADFMRDMRGLGVLDDTLVLITSDESAGLPGDTGQGLAARLAANWGILIALFPSGQTAAVDEPFMQVDVQASVLDHLGADPVRATTGRSVFRRYASPRPMLFANTFHRSLAMIDETGALTRCRETFGRCTRHATRAGRTFTPHPEPIRIDLAHLRVMRAVAERSIARPGAPAAIEAIALLEDPTVRVRNQRGSEYLFGGQNLWLPAGTRIDVSIHLRATGGDGELAFHTRFRHDRDPEAFDHSFIEMRADDELVLRYSYRSADEMHNVQIRGGADTRGDGPMVFEFLDAQVRLVPAGTAQATAVPLGITVHEMAIYRR